MSPSRKAKLDKELEELDNAEQYVLLAMFNNYYPCFNCGATSTIYLNQGEVWKYGVTRKGEKGRYGNWHTTQGLSYFTEYNGTILECLRLEKIKIYNYALLAENILRTTPLIRPPGNKIDN